MKEAKYMEEKDNRRIEEPDDGAMEIDVEKSAQALVAGAAPCCHRSGGFLRVSDAAV